MPHSVRARTHNLIARFRDYVRVFETAPAFSPEQLQAHRRTLARRKTFESAGDAATDPDFADALWSTLASWRMKSRGAKLVSIQEFRGSLQTCASLIDRLDGRKLDEEELPVEETADAIWHLIGRLRVSTTNTRLVGATKALHHVLPCLIVPMDRQFTGGFFGWTQVAWQSERRQESSFKEAFRTFAEIAKKTRPGQYVVDFGWNTSLTKVIDNAIVGYCRQHAVDAASRDRAILKRAEELGVLVETGQDSPRGST